MTRATISCSAGSRRCPGSAAIGTHADPIMLEVFNNLFMSIAEQMGVTLQNTAYSVNMKERLDFSCALFDADGMLIANAPHMPVHLGSMGESVRTILSLRGAGMRPGDVFALNNPYNGGTHLPDVTVVMPVFGEGGRLLFLTASRGHHADIGGITPGSMPPDSTTIDEEGVLIDNFMLVDQGRLARSSTRCSPVGPLSGAQPAPERGRSPGPDRGLRARRGELARMIGQFGLDTVLAYTATSRTMPRSRCAACSTCSRTARSTYPLDNGAVIRVRVRIDREARRAGRLHRHERAARRNFNAPAAVTAPPCSTCSAPWSTTTSR